MVLCCVSIRKDTQCDISSRQLHVALVTDTCMYKGRMTRDQRVEMCCVSEVTRFSKQLTQLRKHIMVPILLKQLRCIALYKRNCDTPLCINLQINDIECARGKCMVTNGTCVSNGSAEIFMLHNKASTCVCRYVSTFVERHKEKKQ